MFPHSYAGDLFSILHGELYRKTIEKNIDCPWYLNGNPSPIYEYDRAFGEILLRGENLSVEATGAAKANYEFSLVLFLRHSSDLSRTRQVIDAAAWLNKLGWEISRDGVSGTVQGRHRDNLFLQTQWKSNSINQEAEQDGSRLIIIALIGEWWTYNSEYYIPID